MEIQKRQTDDGMELTITGRLDAYWSDHLSNEIKSTIRDGNHHLILDLSGVEYISSAGISVLLMYYQELSKVEGSLVVSKLSGFAKSILEMAGLASILVRKPDRPAPSARVEGQQIQSERAKFELFPLQATGKMRCNLLGNPALLEQAAFSKEHTTKIQLTKGSFALGVGAFGGEWLDVQKRFGEFLAVAGAATYLPTDGTNIPDYLVTTGSYTPEIVILYGAICEGTYSHLLRFESKKEQGSVSLVEVIETAAKVLDTSRFGAVLIGETAALVGASLAQSPTAQYTGGPFVYPEVVNWFSFTAERAHSRSVALIVGMTDDSKNHNDFLRPLSQDSKLSGHFHAAAFPYRTLKKGELELQSTVSALFEGGRMEGLLHLLHDDREIGGAGETELIRGACWISPITEMGKQIQ
jgi:anti-anti-sigma factor